MPKGKMSYGDAPYMGKDSGGGTFKETSGTAGGSAKSAEMMARVRGGKSMSGRHDSGTDLGDFLRRRQRAGGVKQNENM